MTQRISGQHCSQARSLRTRRIRRRPSTHSAHPTHFHCLRSLATPQSIPHRLRVVLPHLHIHRPPAQFTHFQCSAHWRHSRQVEKSTLRFILPRYHLKLHRQICPYPRSRASRLGNRCLSADRKTGLRGLIREAGPSVGVAVAAEEGIRE